MSYAGRTPNFDELEILDQQVVYFGDKSTDGSWRIRRDGTTLKIDVRVAGVWENKDTINQ